MNDKKLSVTLLILTLNEISGLKAIMPQINRDWIDEIIIVDGGSKDGTIEYAKANGYPLYIQPTPGLGAAYREGLKYSKGDIIITFSPDGNSDPQRIPDLIGKMREGHDIVIVSRYCEWAKSEDDDFLTGLGNWGFTKLFNTLFGTSLTDVLVMYRAFKKSIVEELGVNTKSIPWQTQLLAKSAKRKLKICEIPGNEPPRIGGFRKMNPFRNGMAELNMMFGEFFKK
ncbi:MAG: glycosyltransferase family 2 protein [Candidatus Omnitrophica bacterium]|nr:glycosyltransferase family 2 protein [Candidatus Omnitrophota bacterium]